MKKAYLTLIKNALSRGLTISVWDGEEWQVKRSTSYQAIKEAIESVELAELRLRNEAGEVVGWAQIIPDLDPEETVSDCTYSPLMSELCGEVFA
jgi:hypothetical protein